MCGFNKLTSLYRPLPVSPRLVAAQPVASFRETLLGNSHVYKRITPHHVATMMHPGPDPEQAGGDGKTVLASKSSQDAYHIAEHLLTHRGSKN